MLKLIDIEKSFGNNQVLRGISLTFEPGKTYGIVGQNGAGKTTLFRSIAGLEPYKGEIESEYSPLKNSIGYLQTIPHFMTYITGTEYLQYAYNARSLANKSIEENNIFDLPLNEFAGNYSTGMKKKLALTSILLSTNQYYILDEPFSGVDIQSNILITAILRKLKEKGKTVIISSHVFSTLTDICDEIHLIQQGKITRSATPRDYASLESEMKETLIGNKVDALDI